MDIYAVRISKDTIVDLVESGLSYKIKIYSILCISKYFIIITVCIYMRNLLFHSKSYIETTVNA